MLGSVGRVVPGLEAWHDTTNAAQLECPMKFLKYHALGNDYLVLDPEESPEPPSAEDIRLICHRNFGIGSDGILYGPGEAQNADFSLRIFNPDGSEAETSGNGLRIFSRYLWDTRRVDAMPFTVSTLGGKVTCQIASEGELITVEMGSVSFNSKDIPVDGPDREVLNEEIELKGKRYRFYAATVGNPHCVLPLPEISSELARELGPILESHPLFPNRTNVQFMKILDRRNIQIEIWERGAGYTLASGSSSTAAAAVAYKLGSVDAKLTVHMPGGEIHFTIGEHYSMTMTGPATRVARVELDRDALTQAGNKNVCL